MTAVPPTLIYHSCSVILICDTSSLTASTTPLPYFQGIKEASELLHQQSSNKNLTTGF